MSNTFLVGSKTILRPVELSDAPTLTRWMNDPVTRLYLTRRLPLTELNEKSFIEKISTLSVAPSSIVLIIEDKECRKPVGVMGLHDIHWINRKAVTGTVIGEESYRGKGYATDAKMILLKYAFEDLGLHKITSHAFAANQKSIDYSKRCGYKVEAILRDEIFHEGTWVDMVSLACFYDDWKEVSRN